MSVWSLTYDHYDPESESLRESLCTLGNGYFATRGAAPESSADGVHYPGTYMAGYFNELTSTIAERDVTNEDMVNMPNWLPISFRIKGGPPFSIDDVDILEFEQALDLKTGVLLRRVRFRDAGGRTSLLTQRRFVHMSHRHLAGLETTLVAEDWSGEVEFEAALDGRVENAGVPRYRELEGRHLTHLEQGTDDDQTVWLEVETCQSRHRIGQAARISVRVAESPAYPTRESVTEPGYVAQTFTVRAEQEVPVTVEKVVAVFGSRDKAISEPLYEAKRHVGLSLDFDALLRSHVLTWDHLWKRFGTSIADHGHTRSRMVLNLHILHLLQTASPNCIDMDVGVPARGLTGEAYRGHIFWDEVFIFPYLNFRMPEITRSLLMYRYRRLSEARRNARAQGLRGALYPWQSGSNGEEETQQLHLNPLSGEWHPDNSYLQRHINVAVAWNVWHYYETTGDSEFMAYAGTEMLIELARFFASIAMYDRSEDRYVIRGVLGPDEYHDAYPDAEEPGLDNNAYTNVMAAWTMLRAKDALDLLRPNRREELWERLSLEREELEEWDAMSRKLKVPFHEGVISQFEGYENLKEFDWHGYCAEYGDIQRLDRILTAEGDSPNNYKLSKQADVLMLFYLLSSDQLQSLFERLGYAWSHDLVTRTIDYYSVRTSHGSTLSRVVHSWVLARHDHDVSWSFFTDALESDVADIQGGTTSEGIHLGAMAGTVDLVQRCFTGIEPRAEVLWFDPCLPEELSEISFGIRYRTMWLDVRITADVLEVFTSPGECGSCKIGLGDSEYELVPGGQLVIPLSQDSEAGDKDAAASA